MTDRSISEEYYACICSIVYSPDRFSSSISYHNLLRRLYDTEFTWTVALDSNRARDGIELRHRFAATELGGHYMDKTMDHVLHRPCSVLEMMIALAVRCEEDIMDDPGKGNRTAQWFWQMVTNLGLGGMWGDNYDEKAVDAAIARFLERRYEPNGRFGLFTVRNSEFDLREVEIWVQMLWYLNTIS